MVDRARDRRCKIIVTDVPRATRVALDEHARRHDLSRNEVAIEALAEHFRLSLSDRRSGSYRPLDIDREAPWSLEVPERVRAALRVAAARKGATISGLVKQVLAEKFGLPVEDAKRKPRSR